MKIPVMRVIVMKMNAKLLLLIVSVVHICALTGECSANFHTKTGVQVRYANEQLVAASGLGDVGFPTIVLLVPQFKTNLISEGKLALSEWKIMTYNRVKDVFDEKWNKVMVAIIQNESNPLYIVDPVYFPAVENAKLIVSEGPVQGIVFAGMADHEGQGRSTGERSRTSRTKKRSIGITYIHVG